ncbi:hypothetical protein PUN28_011032 [Cardiocondyla obscurior]|uniref:Uncharacterized protein n=1 Tax=Cardiocondyla obscurior TaxID=286306 RepID=A0AAW2FM73_9HYME
MTYRDYRFEDHICDFYLLVQKEEKERKNKNNKTAKSAISARAPIAIRPTISVMIYFHRKYNIIERRISFFFFFFFFSLHVLLF